jgi:predicted dehydrogenase
MSLKTRKIRVALVGCGRWANLAHLPGLASCSDVELVSLCDLDASRAEAAAAKFGAQRTYTDLSQMLANEQLDMVDIVTAHHHHLTPAKMALAAGCHVLCEKPLGIDMAQVTDVVESSRKTGVLTMTGFTFRYSRAVQQFQRLIAEGLIGDLYHFHGYEQNGLYMDPTVPVRPHTLKRATNGGALGGYGSHLVDLVRWVAGETLSVIGNARIFLKQRPMLTGGMGDGEVDDGTAWIADMQNGVQGLFQVSKVAAGTPPGVEMSAYGTKGCLMVKLRESSNGCEQLWHATNKDQEIRQIPVQDEEMPWESGMWPSVYFKRLMQDWVGHLKAGTQPGGGFEDALKAQAILHAIEQSCSERRWVDVPNVGGETK